MNPSRDLDALVAEKVMGWTLSTHEHRVTDPDGWSIRKILIPPKGEWILKAYQLEPGMNSVSIPIPSYSTDIAAAWAVIEALEKRGITTSLSKRNYPSGPCDVWDCVLTELVDKELRGFVHHRIESKTIPNAICLAALRAVGVDVETD